MAEDRYGAWLALGLALLLVARALPAGQRSEAPRGEPPARGAARLLWDLPLDLNREHARDLEALPGIGPGRARAIVGGRPYCAVADLERVRGIGPATLRALAGRVSVGPSPVCTAERGD